MSCIYELPDGQTINFNKVVYVSDSAFSGCYNVIFDNNKYLTVSESDRSRKNFIAAWRNAVDHGGLDCITLEANPIERSVVDNYEAFMQRSGYASN